MDKHHIGIIGCGRVSQAYIDAVREMEEVTVGAVCDIRKNAAIAIAEQVGAVPFDSLDAYLSSDAVSLSIVCTPPNTHSEICHRLLERGHHVLCEKPLAINPDEGIRMLEKAAIAERVLMMASKFRFVKDIEEAKGMVSSRFLGNVHFFENTFCQKVSMKGRWNIDPHISGGGVLIDNGTHAVDIARYLLGPITDVFAEKLAINGEVPVEDTVRLNIKTERGVEGGIFLSWTFSPDRSGFIHLYGTEANVRIGFDSSSFEMPSHPKEWIPFGKGYNKVDAFKGQLQNFIDATEGKGEPLMTNQDAIASLKAVHAGYRSLKTGRWEKVV